jgi:prepilin-type N-terminal cleavage/methylation domain-containing protein
MKNVQGLSLIEVLVAILLLSIGVIAAAGLQGTALSASNKASRIQGVTKAAESELDYRRQIDLEGIESEPCETGAEHCTVVVTPCDVIVSANSASFDCSETITDVKAYKVTVSVDGPGDADITLTTHVAQSQNRNALDFSIGNETSSSSNGSQQ